MVAVRVAVRSLGGHLDDLRRPGAGKDGARGRVGRAAGPRRQGDARVGSARPRRRRAVDPRRHVRAWRPGPPDVRGRRHGLRPESTAERPRVDGAPAAPRRVASTGHSAARARRRQGRVRGARASLLPLCRRPGTLRRRAGRADAGSRAAALGRRGDARRRRRHALLAGAIALGLEEDLEGRSGGGDGPRRAHALRTRRWPSRGRGRLARVDSSRRGVLQPRAARRRPRLRAADHRGRRRVAAKGGVDAQRKGAPAR
mmetsp:Transcript_288/g.878  ORF Transcript_288/g.878 Transcript_288/m.878 type:complete len:257 (-) Transcript_288:158-928(-)